MAAALRVRFHIIRNARTENVGKYHSCMVSKLRIIWKQTVAQPQVVAHSVGGGRSGSHTIEGATTLRDGEREQPPPLLRQSPVGVAQLVHGLHCLHSALAEKLQRVAPSEVLVESVACW